MARNAPSDSADTQEWQTAPMAKRPDSYESLHILLEILRRVPRRQMVTAESLHRQLHDAGFDRDLRSVQRQLEMLSRHGMIDRDERSKPYGYRWLEHASALTLPSLTPQESLLLRLAEEHLKNLLPAHLLRSMDGFFQQARRNLATGAGAVLERQWPAKIRVVATSQPLLPPKIAAGVLDTASEALYANRWLHLDYRNAAGKRSKIEVMPLGLVQQGVCLYLVCRYRDFEDQRSLALHRILSAAASSLTFTRPPEFDLKRFDEDGHFGFGEGKRVRLSFRIERGPGAHLLETPLSQDQKVVERRDGTLQITATVVGSEILDWWLRGFGDAVSHVKIQPISSNSRTKAKQHRISFEDRQL